MIFFKLKARNAFMHGGAREFSIHKARSPRFSGVPKNGLLKCLKKAQTKFFVHEEHITNNV